ncbi:MAG: DUF3408 domain-containing protein [Rikenellaceae bacterium]
MAVEIDEKKIQEMVAKGMPKQMEPAPTIKGEQPILNDDICDDDLPHTKIRVTKRVIEDYKAQYLNSVSLRDRQLLYIDGDLHEKLIDILHVTTTRKVNISSYVMNIIRGHLEDKKDIINTMYNKRVKNPL